MPSLTIITPTYNRANTLTNGFNALLKQSCYDFQWLIIDDGSTDNTKEVVQQFRSSTDRFEIDYHYKENGGKHTALNEAHPFIRGRYVVIVDSDDILSSDAVETILMRWKAFDNDKRVGRIIFLKGYSVNRPICYVKNEGIPLNTLREPRIGSAGRDCCDTFRTELFKKHPFPVFPDERFIGEGTAFTPMEMESLGVYYNKVLLIGNYLDDGLTKAGVAMRIHNPKGGMANSLVHMHPKLSLKTRFKKGILYNCYGKFAKVSFKDALQNNPYKALTLTTYLPGVLLHHYWVRKYLQQS